VILFHGTTSRNVDGIRRGGLRMRREIPDEPTLPARVCLTTDYDEATSWGDGTVVVVDVPDNWVHERGYAAMDEQQVHHNISPSMIVRIDTPTDGPSTENCER